MKTGLLIFTVLLTVVFVDTQSSTDLSKINKEDLLKTVKILSSKEFEGRLPRSESYNKAAQFAVDMFYEPGLKPAGDEKYF